MRGDIVIVHTNPPHIASISSEGMLICEDGSRIAKDSVKCTEMYKAIDIIRSLEEEVIAYGSRGFCDN